MGNNKARATIYPNTHKHVQKEDKDKKGALLPISASIKSQSIALE